MQWEEARHCPSAKQETHAVIKLFRYCCCCCCCQITDAIDVGRSWVCEFLWRNRNRVYTASASVAATSDGLSEILLLYLKQRRRFSNHSSPNLSRPLHILITINVAITCFGCGHSELSERIHVLGMENIICNCFTCYVFSILFRQSRNRKGYPHIQIQKLAVWENRLNKSRLWLFVYNPFVSWPYQYFQSNIDGHVTGDLEFQWIKWAKTLNKTKCNKYKIKGRGYPRLSHQKRMVKCEFLYWQNPLYVANWFICDADQLITMYGQIDKQ